MNDQRDETPPAPICRACGAAIGPDDEYWQDGRAAILCLDCGADRLYGVTG